MKKLILPLLALMLFSGCSVDDVNEDFYYELAKITNNDLPQQFEIGKTYQLTIGYILPSHCSTFAGIDARRAGNSGDLRREIYVAAIGMSRLGNNCDENVPGTTGSAKISILVDEEEDYTFKFWIGEDASENPVYETVVIPVQEADITPEN